MYDFGRVQLQASDHPHCTMTVATDGSDGLPILLKVQPTMYSRPTPAHGVLQERQDPSETSEGLTHILQKIPLVSDHGLGKIK